MKLTTPPPSTWTEVVKIVASVIVALPFLYGFVVMYSLLLK